MQYTSGVIPRKQISEFIIFGLSKNGRTINEIEKDFKKQVFRDESQNKYKDKFVWHGRTEIIHYVAKEMKLHSSLWGSKRTSSEFYNAMDQEIAKLKKKNIIVGWNSSKHTGVFRLKSTNQTIKKPVVNIDPSTKLEHQGMEKDGLKETFLSILKEGIKDNTYKFALARVLLDYCKENRSTNADIYEIPYKYLASKFLKYYWHQECKFRIKQDFKINSRPKVIQAIRKVFGENPPGSFDLLNKDDIDHAEYKILQTVFGSAKSKSSLVVPKFQKIKIGKYAIEKKIFYDYDDNKKILYLKSEAFDFFKNNYGILTLAVLAEWAKFLEKINMSLPRLVRKIEQNDIERGVLTKFKNIYIKHTNHCFYCCDKLEYNYIHVDHFIPWSYIFEDESWNLVLACQDCNCKKSNSLPQLEFQDMLIKRNYMYRDRILDLERSLGRIDTKIGWSAEIRNQYTNCKEYGFNVIHMP